MHQLQSHHRIGPRQRQVGGIPGRYCLLPAPKQSGPFLMVTTTTAPTSISSILTKASLRNTTPFSSLNQCSMKYSVESVTGSSPTGLIPGEPRPMKSIATTGGVVSSSRTPTDLLEVVAQPGMAAAAGSRRAIPTGRDCRQQSFVAEFRTASTIHPIHRTRSYAAQCVAGTLTYTKSH